MYIEKGPPLLIFEFLHPQNFFSWIISISKYEIRDQRAKIPQKKSGKNRKKFKSAFFVIVWIIHIFSENLYRYINFKRRKLNIYFCYILEWNFQFWWMRTIMCAPYFGWQTRTNWLEFTENLIFSRKNWPYFTVKWREGTNGLDFTNKYKLQNAQPVPVHILANNFDICFWYIKFQLSSLVSAVVKAFWPLIHQFTKPFPLKIAYRRINAIEEPNCVFWRFS
jgi:hypothetical protein